ncbi:MAG: translation initiation factor IF-2 [Candidatus Omnitrophota bacterium]
MTEEKKKKIKAKPKVEAKSKVKHIKKEPAKVKAVKAPAKVAIRLKPSQVKPVKESKPRVIAKKKAAVATAAIHPVAIAAKKIDLSVVIEKPEIKITPPSKHIPKEAKPAPIIAKVLPEKELSIPPQEEVIKAEERVVPVADGLKELELDLPITVKDFSIKLQQKSSEVIKILMGMGIMAGLNQSISDQALVKVSEKFGFKIKRALGREEQVLSIHEVADDPKSLKPRSAIVTFMGHVDHGKTSLLDAIRKSKVVDSEHGGITQHIGAYRVKLAHGEITFLDTPGHEAFTAMRARGAKATDIVVLVVAADDGVMPQTKEAIDHAKAAGVSIIVALNKIDKPQADLSRVKKQLAGLELSSEDWGGKTITVGVSAKTGAGIDDLLELIILESQMLELKANPDRLARGVVLESKLIKSKGPIASLLVQNGTLKLNDNIVVGKFYGKVRAMFNDHGIAVAEAGPAVPVEVLGINGVPEAGETFFVIADDKTARELALKRQEAERERMIKPVMRMGLEDLYSQIKEGKLKELKLIIKADAQGSLEAIKDILGKIDIAEIRLIIIHDGIGNVNTSDVILAIASNALILGFNIVVEEQAKEMINKEGQEVRIYNIIYELANDIKSALVGMLEPKLKRIFIGRAEIRKVFKLSTHGIIAGSMVTKGKIMRNLKVNLIRNGEVAYEGELSSLKRFKDDVREVEEGFECGIALKGYDGIMEGDVIEVFEIKKIARTLE